jgi:hypothetical protein
MNIRKFRVKQLQNHINEEMRKYFPKYEEAVSHILLCDCSILNVLMYEENFIFFFISVQFTLELIQQFFKGTPYVLGTCMSAICIMCK